MCCGSITGLSEIRESDIQADSTGIPDSLFVQPVYLKNLYASLEDTYPGTPHADRARRVRESILAEVPPGEADSAGTTVDTMAVPDTTGSGSQLAPADDSAAAQGPPEVSDQEPVPADTSAAAGETADERAPVQRDSTVNRPTEMPDRVPSDSSAAPPVPDDTPPSETPADSTDDDQLKGVEP